MLLTVADPDLELREGGGAVLTYLPCRPFSLQSFLLFLPKIRGGGGPPLDPPLVKVRGESMKVASECVHIMKMSSIYRHRVCGWYGARDKASVSNLARNKLA